MRFFCELLLKPPPEEGNQQVDKDGDGKPKDKDGAQGNNGKGENGQTKPKGGEGNAYEEKIYRQDNNPNSSQGSREGRIKSSVNENGDVVPANKDGSATIQDHVRGSEPKKSDSPYTSFSEGEPGVGKKYGNEVIEVDVRNLEADIANGKIKDVEVIRPERVQAELQDKINNAQERYNNNPTPKNLERIRNSELDLEHAIRDREVLVRGQIPSEYVKVVPNNH